MSDTATDTTAPAPTWRIAPSVPVAIGVFIAYVVVFQPHLGRRHLLR